MNLKTAKNLWKQAREGLVSAEKALVLIVKAGPSTWEPLGYATFFDAWKSELSESRLATNYMKAQIAYEFFKWGLTDKDIVEMSPANSGLTPDGVKRLREQYGMGVPPEAATTHHKVRPHERANPSPASVVKVDVGPDDYATWKAVAEALGSSLELEAQKALRKHFRTLDRTIKRAT